MNEENRHIEYTDLIGKYLAREASEEEIKMLEEWVKNDPENKQTFLEMKQIWILSKATNTDHQIDLDGEWEQLQSRLFGQEEYVDILPAEGTAFHYNRFLKMAAVIVVLLTAGYFLFYLISSPSSEQLVARNSNAFATLPDGTKVTLNHNSILKYPKLFASNIRAVHLQGDAYFDVKHDLSKPFVIQTKNVKIEVLGTSFYVNAKVEQPTVDIIVQKGKVAIIGDNKERILLLASEKGTYNKSDGRLSKQENRDKNFMSWKTRNLYFTNESLINVIDKINQTYHSNITIDNPDIYHCLLTATFEDQPIEIILEVLQETFDLVVESKNGEILITGDGCK